MTGDFTRDTFNPAKSYSAVRMQQGRLFTDADWNEQADITRDAERKSARAIIGASGFPEDNAGFAILAGADGQQLLIGTGEAYVEGIRVENGNRPQISLERFSGANANTQWKVVAGERLAIGDALALVGQGAPQALRVTEILPDNGGRQLIRCAAALSAANAIQVIRFRSVESQPNLAFGALNAPNGTYLAYLDVWERPVGTIEDPSIRETAFGGPDTAGRDKILWQVKLASIADLVAAGAATIPVSCKSFGPGWSPFGPGVLGRLAARATATTIGGDPCVLPATGGYRSLDNRLYRVEVHNGASLASGKLAIKWSRDNAIHRSAYSEIDSGKIVVATTGNDEASSLKKDDWIEILDEDRILASKPGFFGRIVDVNGKRLTLDRLLDPDTLADLGPVGNPNMAALPAAGQIRRWEGGAPVLVANTNWLQLEDGVEVRFEEGRFAAGGHWLIPARTLSASVEWPQDSATGEPMLQAPAGIKHHYCALGLLTKAAQGWSIVDCRAIFAPLTLQRGFLYLGGDGQEAMPIPANTPNLTTLATPLRAGVVRGKTPVAGAIVEFRVVAGNGRLGAVGDNLAVRQVLTDALGVAAVDWSVDSATQVQRVEARLLDSAGTPTHLPIHFSANLSRASMVSFDPTNVPALAGSNTVQEAIEKLLALKEAGCSTYVVVEGSDWVSVLKNIKPKENAAVCFQRGQYETDEPVELTGLGHITLSGAGSGTRIVAKKGECALKFEGCASVTVHDIAISAPDGGAPNWKPGVRPMRMGALTLLDCNDVDVFGTSLECGGDAFTARTCLTVRGNPEKPLGSVRIMNNRLLVGYAQDGVLVTDCDRCVIQGNEIDIAPRSRKLTFERLLGSPAWRKRLLDQLFSDVKEGSGGGKKGSNAISVGGFRASFDSTISQKRWERLMAENPPAAAINSMAGFKSYVETLVESVVENPEKLAGFEKTISRLEEPSGGGAGAARLGKEVRRALAIGSAIEFEKEDVEPRPTEGRVSLGSGNGRINFRSTVSEQDWRSAMQLAPPRDVSDSASLVKHARSLAIRMIADTRFRNKLGSARNWFMAFAKALPAFGDQAITCGGAVLGEVTISGNSSKGFVQGVHVGVSNGGDRKQLLRAGSVSILDNRMLCRKASPDAYAPCALFLGNMESARIEGNIVGWASTGQKRGYAQGIRVWGELGRYLVIARNRISVASLGIRIKPLQNVDDSLWPNYLWLVDGNLADGVDPALVLRAPPWTIDRDNRPK